MSKTPPTPNQIPATPAAPVKPPKPDQRSRAVSFIGYLVRGRRRPGEVVVVSHSDLFYWWPVWLVGFIMAGVTWIHGVHSGFINGHPEVIEIVSPEVSYKSEKAPNKVLTEKITQAIISDNDKNPFPTTTHGGEMKHFFPLMHNSKTPGVIFIITLVLVIVITNIHLRGLWSLVVIIIVVLGSVIFALAGWWDEILTRGRLLAIHINMGAYLFLSLTLFIIWLVNFAFFDRQRYVAVTPGQVRLHLAIGEGEIVYDTMGMVFQKQRSDLFRHWILGFGSGDLVIRPAGGKDAIDLPNVLFVGSKVQEIQELIKEKEVVAG